MYRIKINAAGCVGKEAGFSPRSVYLFLVQREAFQNPRFFVIYEIVEAIHALYGDVVIKRVCMVR